MRPKKYNTEEERKKAKNASSYRSMAKNNNRYKWKYLMKQQDEDYVLKSVIEHFGGRYTLITKLMEFV